MTSDRLTPTRLSLLGFISLLLIAWFCYRPGLGGDFQLDDRSNLSGLAAVEDLSTAVDFVLSGTAGPTGRPLALLTFALQADHWHQGAEAFLRVNVLIHLFNAVLLAACLYLVTLARGAGRSRAAVVAALAAGCWVLAPLLATSSLLVVQRMTTLSAAIVLLGMFAYLLARGWLDQAPKRALGWMSASIALATPLAMLSKETGILLPVYILVLEGTLLQHPSNLPTRLWRSWQAAFLVTPLVFLLFVLATRSAYPDWIVARRGFDGWERLLTELPILWLYLKKVLFGLPSTLGIYLPEGEVRRSLFEPVVLMSAVAWASMIAAAVMWRRRWPLFGFAVFWYLAGHLLESTVISLELYFEHRNYLPVAGPLYAMVAASVMGGRMARRAAMALLPVYLAVNAMFLYTFASLWGEPSAASRYWAFRYPGAVRAVTTMATYQLGEEGPLAALSTIDQFVLRQPQYGYLRIQELNIRCQVMPAENHDPVIAELLLALPSVDFSYTAGAMLSQLHSTVIQGNCNGVGIDEVARFASAFLDNRRYAGDPAYNEFHHRLMASIARNRGDLDKAIDHLEIAMNYRTSDELNMMMVTALGTRGDFALAREFIENSLARAPRNPMRAFVWRKNLEQLRLYINDLERYSAGEQ